jgi:hypothetical protein
MSGGIERMNPKNPTIEFLVLGILFIVFSKQILVGIQWLDKATWNEKKRKQFPGHGGKSSDYKPWMVMVLGVSWIVCAAFVWLTSK